jgi:hypothetical protein
MTPDTRSGSGTSTYGGGDPSGDQGRDKMPDSNMHVKPSPGSRKPEPEQQDQMRCSDGQAADPLRPSQASAAARGARREAHRLSVRHHFGARALRAVPDADQARDLLATFEEMQEENISHRDRLKRELLAAPA